MIPVMMTFRPWSPGGKENSRTRIVPRLLLLDILIDVDEDIVVTWVPK